MPRNGPVTLRAPSYVMSAKRFTTPKRRTKLSAERLPNWIGFGIGTGRPWVRRHHTERRHGCPLRGHLAASHFILASERAYACERGRVTARSRHPLPRHPAP